MNPLLEKWTKDASFEWSTLACGGKKITQAKMIEQGNWQNLSLIYFKCFEKY